MIIRANSFGSLSRHFPVKTEVSPADEIELLSIGGDAPLPECKLSKTIARQSADRTREKIVAGLPAAKECQVPREAVASHCLSQEQALTLLKKLSMLLQPAASDPEAGCVLEQLIVEVSQFGDKPLPLDMWDRLGRKLGTLAKRMSSDSTRQLSGNPGLQFIQTNIHYLGQVCQHTWLSQSHAALVEIFAREIEQQVVANPSLADVETTRLSLDVALPVPLLSAGGEISYLRSKTIDDEGNYVTTTSVSGGFGCKISALFASARGKALGSLGCYEYLKTAQDHARHFFKQLLEKNRHLPFLQQYLSSCPESGVAALGNFDKLQHSYLQQQSHYSQSLSVLLSLGEPGGAANTSPNTSPYAPKISLKAAAPKNIRGTKGTVTGVALTAEGYAGLLQAQLGLTGKGKSETKRTTRVLTLCELIRHGNTDAATKARISRQILNASSPIRKKTGEFWNRQNGLNVTSHHIACLTQDWNAYVRMHAAHAAGHATTAAVLEAFHKKYGARNVKDCLRRMALLVATFYIELKDLQPGEETDKLTTAVLELEHAMHHSSIPDARKYLAAHALARQRIEYVSDETTVQFTVGEPPPMGGTAPGVKIISRNLHHYNSLRAGEYVTVELAMGNNLGANQRALKSVADYFNVGTTGLAKFFGSASYVQCGVHTIRFFRPSVFAGLPFSKQYERRTEQSGTQMATTVPIPLGALTLQAGFAHAQTSSRFVSETPGTDSMLYFATHYMHALSSGKTTMTGEKVQNSFWYRIELEQPAVLQELFIQYARDADVPHGRRGLLHELDVIEATLANSPVRLQQLQASSSVFLAAAIRLEQERSAENYQAALDEFKALLRCYYPDWQRNKEASAAYKSWQVKPG